MPIADLFTKPPLAPLLHNKYKDKCLMFEPQFKGLKTSYQTYINIPHTFKHNFSFEVSDWASVHVLFKLKEQA